MNRTARVESTVRDLLSDPMVRLLMERDGIEPDSVWACLQRVWHRRNVCAQRETRHVTASERVRADAVAFDTIPHEEP